MKWISLLVDVRRSKTPLPKLPNKELKHQTFLVPPTPAGSIFTA